MARFIACVCVGIMVLLPPSRADSQEAKRPGAPGDANNSHTVQNKGVVFLDYDNDGLVDDLVTGGPADQSGRGIAVVDVGNDGKPDLFMVENARQNHFYRNRGDGTFEEVTDNPMIETIKIEGGKVEINGQSIKIEGAKVEIIRRH
jgi:FG-GAP-like repeat